MQEACNYEETIAFPFIQYAEEMILANIGYDGLARRPEAHRTWKHDQGWSIL